MTLYSKPCDDGPDVRITVKEKVTGKGFETGPIPTHLTDVDAPVGYGIKTIVRRYMFPLPKEPLNGVFTGEETAGVDVSYMWAPRYKAWMLSSAKPFCGLWGDV